MRIVCWQTILMKYHSLFISKIRKEVAKFVVCCSCDLRFKGYNLVANNSHEYQHYLPVIQKNNLPLVREQIENPFSWHHRLSSLDKSRDAKQWSLGQTFLSRPYSHDRFLYSCTPDRGIPYFDPI